MSFLVSCCLRSLSDLLFSMGDDMGHVNVSIPFSVGHFFFFLEFCCFLTSVDCDVMNVFA